MGRRGKYREVIRKRRALQQDSGVKVIAAEATKEQGAAERRKRAALFPLCIRMSRRPLKKEEGFDDLAVVRHAARQRRLHKYCHVGILERNLGLLARGHWQVSWLAVHRKHNAEADEVATVGVFWAHRLALQGETNPRWSMQ